jgi:hypothetical protein
MTHYLNIALRATGCTGGELFASMDVAVPTGRATVGSACSRPRPSGQPGTQVTITDRAYGDLVGSGRYSHASFRGREVDGELEAGASRQVSPTEQRAIRMARCKGRLRLRLRVRR